MNLHYTVSGEGTPIILTSGIGDTSEAWTPLHRLLRDRARVLSWDFRGHGRSERCVNVLDYSHDSSVEDLLSMIARAGGRATNPAVLIGHSLGGYLSLKVAQIAPSIVRGLILIATGPGFRNANARSEWNEAVLSMNLGDDVDPNSRTIAQQTDDAVLTGLPRISAPALVVVGSDDRKFIGAKDYLMAKLPNARAVVVEGARHSVHRTHADAVNGAILQFLAEQGFVDSPSLEMRDSKG